MKPYSTGKIDLDLDDHLDHHIGVDIYISVLNKMNEHNMDHMLDDAEIIVQAEDEFNEDSIEGISEYKQVFDIGDLEYYEVKINPNDIAELIKHEHVKSAEMNSYLETHI